MHIKDGAHPRGQLQIDCQTWLAGGVSTCAVSPSDSFARSSQQRGQLVVDLQRREWLSYVSRSSLADGIEHNLRACFRADDEDRQVVPLLTSPQRAEQLNSVHFGHVDVAENGVDAALDEKLQRFPPVPGLTNLGDTELCLAKTTLNYLSHRR